MNANIDLNYLLYKMYNKQIICVMFIIKKIRIRHIHSFLSKGKLCLTYKIMT